MRQAGFNVFAYLDDFAGCSSSYQHATQAYSYFKHLMQKLGLQLAENKCHPPATTVTWLGYTLDTKKMQISIPKAKIDEVHSECVTWLTRSRVNKRALQSFLGNILHVAPCIKHARKFTARMLATLRSMANRSWTTIGQEFKADVKWFEQFSSEANGLSLIAADVEYPVVIECDACLAGAGIILTSITTP